MNQRNVIETDRTRRVIGKSHY